MADRVRACDVESLQTAAEAETKVEEAINSVARVQDVPPRAFAPGTLPIVLRLFQLEKVEDLQ